MAEKATHGFKDYLLFTFAETCRTRGLKKALWSASSFTEGKASFKVSEEELVSYAIGVLGNEPQPRGPLLDQLKELRPPLHKKLASAPRARTQKIDEESIHKEFMEWLGPAVAHAIYTGEFDDANLVLGFLSAGLLKDVLALLRLQASHTNYKQYSPDYFKIKHCRFVWCIANHPTHRHILSGEDIHDALDHLWNNPQLPIRNKKIPRLHEMLKKFMEFSEGRHGIGAYFAGEGNGARHVSRNLGLLPCIEDREKFTREALGLPDFAVKPDEFTPLVTQLALIPEWQARAKRIVTQKNESSRGKQFYVLDTVDDLDVGYLGMKFHTMPKHGGHHIHIYTKLKPEGEGPMTFLKRMNGLKKTSPATAALLVNRVIEEMENLVARSDLPQMSEFVADTAKEFRARADKMRFDIPERPKSGPGSAAGPNAPGGR